jgi:L-iditol 2-dehydrogenase
MEALVKTQRGKGNLELIEVDEPTVEDNEVLIEVKAAGICGTDLHIQDDTFPTNPPVIIGHEFSGEIVEVGTKVKDFTKGDRVVAEPHKGGCGICPHCLTGQVEVCREKKALGYKIDGCFAPRVGVPFFSLHRIPDTVSYEEAAMTEPMAVVVKAVLERSRVEPEDFVVVMGCGAIGLLAAGVSMAEGARSVMITGTDQDEELRLPAARRLNIDHVVNVQKEDVAERVKDLTNGRGADLVVEASGAEQAIRQGFDIVRINGRIAAVGLTGRESVSISWDTAIKKAVELKCSFSSTWTSWERSLSILANRKVDVRPLITRTLPLREWSSAFEQLRKLEAIKTILVP